MKVEILPGNKMLVDPGTFALDELFDLLDR